jgi:4,5-DOPA dioxygenase extradiol
MKMPVMFFGHGSPMNVVLENDFTNSLKTFSKSLPVPKAIMLISAHWLTEGTVVTTNENPRQIYDFYGFPEELYNVKYQCKGFPKIMELLKDHEIEGSIEWGIDHGAWSILKYLFPLADIPVVQLSIDMSKNEQYHYDIGKSLKFLRDQDILIIGSGNIVHNLGKVDFRNLNAIPFTWGIDFDSEIKKMIIDNNYESLIDYKNLGEIASLSLPTDEHYLPLLYIQGLRDETDELEFIYEGFQNKSISMRSFILKEKII